jgi:hypothetical protein
LLVCPSCAFSPLCEVEGGKETLSSADARTRSLCSTNLFASCLRFSCSVCCLGLSLPSLPPLHAFVPSSLSWSLSRPPPPLQPSDRASVLTSRRSDPSSTVRREQEERGSEPEREKDRRQRITLVCYCVSHSHSRFVLRGGRGRTGKPKDSRIGEEGEEDQALPTTIETERQDDARP